MKARFLAVFALPVCICLACDNRHSTEDMKSPERIEQVANDKTPGVTDSTGLPAPSGSKGEPASTTIDWDKKIVKTAVLSGEVNVYKKFSAQLPGLVKNFGGYISSETQSQSEARIENTMVIKVPVDQFENTLSALSNSLVRITEKSVSSDDVTMQLIDGKSRMEAKKQVRLRYLELLRQARNMEEILTVQKEINGIQEEIESVAGRLNFLQHASSMSTIQFTYMQVLDAKAVLPKEERFLDKLGSSFSYGWGWMQELFLGLTSLWPLLLGTAVAVVLYRKRRVK
jgi:hypothetical protein